MFISYFKNNMNVFICYFHLYRNILLYFIYYNNYDLFSIMIYSNDFLLCKKIRQNLHLPWTQQLTMLAILPHEKPQTSKVTRFVRVILYLYFLRRYLLLEYVATLKNN